MYVEYSSNNSGGRWWLTDEDWFALERAGWKVYWSRLVRDYDATDADGTPVVREYDPGRDDRQARVCVRDDGRFLGALAQYAWKPNCSSMREAAEQWERITGKSATDAGCACCGQPHTFTLYGDDGKYVESGPSTSYEASW